MEVSCSWDRRVCHHGLLQVEDADGHQSASTVEVDNSSLGLRHLLCSYSGSVAFDFI